MKVGYFQFNPIFGEVTRNLDHVSERLSRAECDLLVLPELFNSLKVPINPSHLIRAEFQRIWVKRVV